MGLDFNKRPILSSSSPLLLSYSPRLLSYTPLQASCHCGDQRTSISQQVPEAHGSVWARMGPDADRKSEEDAT